KNERERLLQQGSGDDQTEKTPGKHRRLETGAQAECLRCRCEGQPRTGLAAAETATAAEPAKPEKRTKKPERQKGSEKERGSATAATAAETPTQQAEQTGGGTVAKGTRTKGERSPQ